MFIRLKQLYLQYKEQKKAYQIGYRAGKGKNIYLTFGSDKTITKNAHDSYHRYAMAMRHYNEISCNEEDFTIGYNRAKA